MKLSPRRRGDDLSRETRFIWTRLLHHMLVINVPPHPSKSHQRVILSLTRGTNETVRIDLTALTTQELLALRETVDIATEVALPIVKALDQEATEKMNDGDDSDDRIYRPLPTVVVRKGALRKYDQSVLDRRTDVLSGMQHTVLPGSGSVEVSGGLDEQQQAQPSTEDISSTNDKPAPTL